MGFQFNHVGGGASSKPLPCMPPPPPSPPCCLICPAGCARVTSAPAAPACTTAYATCVDITPHCAGTKTRRPITLHMQYNAGCVQPQCCLVTEDFGDQAVTLEELQVGIKNRSRTCVGSTLQVHMREQISRHQWVVPCEIVHRAVETARNRNLELEMRRLAAAAALVQNCACGRPSGPNGGSSVQGLFLAEPLPVVTGVHRDGEHTAGAGGAVLG